MLYGIKYPSQDCTTFKHRGINVSNVYATQRLFLISETFTAQKFESETKLKISDFGANSQRLTTGLKFVLKI